MLGFITLALLTLFVYGFIVSCYFTLNRQKRKSCIGNLMCAVSLFLQAIIPPTNIYIFSMDMLLAAIWVWYFIRDYPIEVDKDVQGVIPKLKLRLTDLYATGWV